MDINPSNIFLTGERTVKLSSFGMAIESNKANKGEIDRLLKEKNH
jgi:serine/threonine protein kinase